jgi:hypothetical protein
MYAFTIFWINVALSRTFFYISDYIIEGTYTGDLSTIIASFDVVSYALLYFYLYFFIYIFINVICLSGMFIWFSIRSKQEFQTISSVMTIGFTVFLIGWAFEIVLIKFLNIVPPALPSILIFTGALIALSPLVIDLDFFSRRMANLIVIISISSIFLFLGFTIFTNLPLRIILIVIIAISSVILAIVVVYLVTNVRKRLRIRDYETRKRKEPLKDFLTMFTKPASFTEKEIEQFLQEKICLVCKSKISGLNYACPQCEILYCARCSDALKKLDNPCWVCETPFLEVTKKDNQEEKDAISIV